MKVGDKVRHRLTGYRGQIIRNLGVQKPNNSNAPLAESYPPEQAWVVRFWIFAKLTHDRTGFEDQHGCWESDLELVEETDK